MLYVIKTITGIIETIIQNEYPPVTIPIPKGLSKNS